MATKGGPKIITDGLVLALDAANPKSYPGSGTTWTDLSNSGNDCTLTNGPSFSSGNKGSILFDGVDDYVNLPFKESLNNVNTTLGVWIKSSYVTGPNNRHYIFDALEHRAAIFVDEPNELNFFVNTSSGVSSVVYIDSRISQNIWLNLVGTYDGSNIKLYLNGELVGTTSHSGNILSASSYGRLMDYRLNGYETQGLAANFTMYNRGITADEVKQNYNAIKSRFGL